MTAMTMTMSSPSKKGGLRGPRPQALKVSSSQPPSSRPSTKKNNSTGGSGAAPVIVYEHTPKVVHAQPHEFMSVVQRLTGKPPTSLQEPLSSDDVHVALVEERYVVGGDPLLLTLGQHRAPSTPMAAGPLMSPGGLFFSPNTMQFIQGISPMF